MGRIRLLALCALACVALGATACTAPTGPNTAPTASFSATPSGGKAPLVVALDASASADPGGTITGHRWDFGDDSPVDTTSGAHVSHTFTQVGTHVVTLTVTDDGGLTATTTRNVVVGATNVAPVAVASANHPSGVEPHSVTFSSSGSSDPDGTIVGWSWKLGAVELSTAPSFTHVLTAGNHDVALTVTDDDGAVASTVVSVSVQPNQPPTANASANPQSGRAPLSVQFSSAGSADDHGISTYLWDFGDGSEPSNAENPLHQYTAVGEHTARLTVTDAQGLTAVKDVPVTVNQNQAPVAIITADPSGGNAPLIVNFSAADSSDDGTIVGYQWMIDGFSATGSTVQYTFGTAGSKTVSLTVTDDNGVSSTATTTIDVSPTPNVPPVAVASGNPTSGKKNLTVVFSSGGSGDSDGTIISRTWNFGDGSAVSTDANPSHTYTTAGDFTATLTVRDNANAIATATVDIHVDPNAVPVAAAAATPNPVKVGKNVAFSSSGSHDPDGAIAGYSWSFGDGATSTDANPVHSYSGSGTFTATLKVTDDSGDATWASTVVTVNLNQAPTATVNATPQSGASPLAVSFTGGGADSDGSIASYAWTFGDGGSSNGQSPSHTYNVAGSYTATLVVTDDDGATSASSSLVITVVVDVDGDGVSPPTDCNDGNASIYPGAADVLDATAIDSNCDGVDGVAADTVLVSATAGSNVAGCGVPNTTPCQTIPFAVTQAGSSRHVVLVTGNGAAYAPFSLASTSGVTVRGGYGADFASRSGTTTVSGGVTISSSTTATLADLTVNGAGGANTTGITISGSTATLKGLTVTSGTAAGVGSSAYGVRATGSTVDVRSSSISASAGIGGISGTTPTGALTPGVNGADGTGGSQHGIGSGGSSGGSGANNGGNGGNGQRSEGDGVAGVNGGAGGAGGCDNCAYSEVYIWPITYDNSYSGAGGGGGKAGLNGVAGANGAASTATFGTTFATTAATNGGTAGNGGGGGGGGGGGRGCDATACAGQWVGGGGGGKGGGGGQGGGGGTAGTSGGGSFAVYGHNSTITIDANTTLVTGNGGNGGNGAVGQVGTAGGRGGAGASGARADCCTGSGGGGGGGGAAAANGSNGGQGNIGTCCNAGSGGGAGGGGGGNGGNGGTGGGGVGGPSVAMAKVGTGSITFGGNVATQVTIGAGGAAGAAPGGNAGAAGTAAKQASF